MTAYLKAVVGALIALLTSLQANLGDGLTASEWISAIIAGLIALGIVFGVPNVDRKAKHQDESVMPPNKP